MRRVYQTRRKLSESGDCLNACLASILELDLRDVPDFAIYEDTKVWWKAAQDFCFTHGFQLFRIELNERAKLYSMPAQPLLIAVGPDAASGAPHACVGCLNLHADSSDKFELALLHDPLNGDGLRSVDAIMFLVPVKPASASRMRRDMGLISNILADEKSSQTHRMRSVAMIASTWKQEEAHE